MDMRGLTGGAIGLALLLLGGSAAAEDSIGAVDKLQGEATGTLSGETNSLAPATTVFLNEIVATGSEARLEIGFEDETTLTLGEQAKMTLDSFVYAPAQGAGSIKMRVVGAFRFATGQAAKLAGTTVTVTTPVASIGVRGTEFWGGPIDDQALGVFLIEGEVTVSNAAGTQVLSEPGQGTNIAAPGAAPGPVTFWPQDKVDRALATVTFQ
jgi:hypothetical protein